MMVSKKFSERFIKIEQPIGDLYMVNLKATDVIDISASDTRNAYNSTGIQRQLEPSRVSNIAKFCESKDAMFPTPVILSASSDNFNFDHENNFLEFTAPGEDKYFSIVDGQHRLAGIERSGLAHEFDLLIAFVFDTDASQDAHLFSIINGNQKPVSKSLIYDLYGLSDKRTVEKVCNKVIRFLNNDDRSEMAGRIKLLGYKDELSPKGTVSQATIMEGLISLISKNTKADNLNIEYSRELEILDKNKYIFRNYFIEHDDIALLSHTLTFFNSWIDAITRVKYEFNRTDFQLFEKSIGFATSFQMLRILFNEYHFSSRKVDTKMKDFYTDSLESIFRSFFEESFDEKSYSSSKSGVNQLLSDLALIGLNFRIISESSLRNSLSSTTSNRVIKSNNREIL